MLSDLGWQSAALDRLLTSGNRRNSTLDNRCCPMCDNFLYVLNGTPSARRAVRPGPLRAWAQGSPRESVGQPRGFPPQAVGLAGEVSPLGAAAQARCLSVGTHGAGRRRSAVPPHPPPGGPRRHAPQLTALAEPPGRPPAPGDPVAAKAPCQGHGLRPRPSAPLRADP